jgi:hypothetical protein
MTNNSNLILIDSPGDKAPTGPPPRASGFTAPTLQDSKIPVVVPDLPGYVPLNNTDNGSGSSPSTTDPGSNGISFDLKLILRFKN